MLVIYSFSFVCYPPLFIACFFNLTFLISGSYFFYAFCLFCYSVSFITLSLCHSVFYHTFSLYYSVSCYSAFPIILSLCHSVSSLSFCLFSSFCRTSSPLFAFSFWLHFYPFICLFFDIFAWIFKYIKILLSFYFFVCLSTLFLFSFVIYVIEFLIQCVII